MQRKETDTPYHIKLHVYCDITFLSRRTLRLSKVVGKPKVCFSSNLVGIRLGLTAQCFCLLPSKLCIHADYKMFPL